jgi:hypothetical protein
MADEPEETIVVCARITSPLMMPDNATGPCSECGAMLQFRPNLPPGRKWCMECAAEMIEDDAVMDVPQRVLDDLKTYLAKKLQ